MGKQRKWSKEELDFIRETYQKYDINQTLSLFNERFNETVDKQRLKGILSLYKIRCGRKSHIAHNKGKKRDEWMSKESQENCRKTQFKKGYTNPKTVPLGTEGLHKGYVVVKTKKQEGQKSRDYWKLKHHLIWEEINGPIPKGYNVIFTDGNTRNFNIDNLALVSDEELAIINKEGLYVKGCSEATKSGILITKIYYKQKELIKCQETH